MRVVVALLWLVCASCIDADLVPCGNGLLCPSGRTCVALTDPDATMCATDAQIAACTGIVDGERCTLDGSDSNVCRSGACVPIACGNSHLDPGEMCDDGNTVTGDSTCSADCLSDETCGNGVVDPLVLVDAKRLPNEQCDDGNLISADGCSSMCRVETPRWQKLETGIGQVACAGVATDFARKRVVMFGGWERVDTSTEVSDRLSEWNGIGWERLRAQIAPQARTEHAMAYDAARHRVVMYGGHIGDDSFALGETWEWDGTVWSQRSTTGPGPRVRHAMVYDGVRKRVVMFGGFGGVGLHNDTWEWDGTQWTQLTTTGAPAPRTYGLMAYDPRRNVIVLAGGQDTAGLILQDTWELSGSTWTQVSSTTPAELGFDASMTFDVLGGRMIAYGGTGSVPRVNRTFAYDATTHTWTDVSPVSPAEDPGGLQCAQLAIDPVTNQPLLQGGYIDPMQLSDKTYRWTGTQWTQKLPPYRVDERTYAASAYDTRHGVSWVFGGFDRNNTLTNTMVGFDGSQWTQVASAGPTARAAAGMAFDRARGKVVMYGGGLTPSSETWLFDGATWSKPMPAHSPGPRIAPAIAYDARRARIVLFGGSDGGAFFDDTWEWDGTDWAQISVPTNPPARMGANIAYDEQRGVIVLQHGFNLATGSPTDLWTYDGTAWTDVTDTTPLSTRVYSGVAYDQASRSVITFGGGAPGSASFSDTWAFDAAGFQRLLVASPPDGRAGAIATQAPDGHGVILYGGASQLGTGNATFADTWLLRYESSDPREACVTTIDNDGDGLAGCADPDCWARCAPSCPPGAMCDPAEPHCGDGQCSAVENCRICPSDCPASAACGDSYCDAGETPASCPGDCTP